MKKILLVLSAVVLLSGCDMIINSMVENQICGQTLYTPKDMPEMKTLYHVASYVEELLDWKSMKLNPIVDPEEAIRLGIGNCTTYAIVFMAVAKVALGIEFDYACADASPYTQRAIVEGGVPDHSMVSLNGQLYSAYTGIKITEYKASYTLSFNNVFIA